MSGPKLCIASCEYYFDEVGAPARAATNIPVVHTTFNLEPEEPQKRYDKNKRVAAIILVQKSSKLAQ